MKKSFGKTTLGGGNKMSVYLHGYGRSTHNLNKVVRTTMNVGTLIPLYTNIGLNGDTWDIDLNALIKTKPAIAPLFGTYKYQVDVFTADMRLYVSALHNNPLNVGLNMEKVKLPTFQIETSGNKVTNSASLLNYLGVRGIGIGQENPKVNAMPLLAYYDIFKNYYANKQETNAYFINGLGTSQGTAYPTITNGEDWSVTGADIEKVESVTMGQTIASITMPDNTEEDSPYKINIGIYDLQNQDLYGSYTINIEGRTSGSFNLQCQLAGQPEYFEINFLVTEKLDVILKWANGTNTLWKGAAPIYIKSQEPVTTTVGGNGIQSFELTNIDKMREAILSTPFYQAFEVTSQNLFPYDSNKKVTDGMTNQNGICLKTFQSDIFQNWLNSEWVDGVNGISEITKVDTSNGLNLDALNLAQKVYNMLNRIAVSGGSWEDWQEAVYGNNALRRAESPVYHGGMSCRIGFEEVTSNASASDAEGDNQPLGTLAGKGQQFGKKGGRVTIHVKEPCVIMVIASITPFIDYSQGNKWFMEELKTINDLHKPALDGIGFQNLPQYQLKGDAKRGINIGKSPAWIHYMTDVNECYGDFAIGGKERYMVLQKEYLTNSNGEITNSTTYIDPTQFNYTFADKEITAQNFWIQQAFDIQCRRVMSAKVIPNL